MRILLLLALLVIAGPAWAQDPTAANKLTKTVSGTALAGHIWNDGVGHYTFANAAGAHQSAIFFVGGTRAEICLDQDIATTDTDAEVEILRINGAETYEGSTIWATLTTDGCSGVDGNARYYFYISTEPGAGKTANLSVTGNDGTAVKWSDDGSALSPIDAGRSISLGAPVSGTDSEVVLKENADYSGTHEAGIRIDAAVDLPADMVMDVGPAGVGSPYVVRYYIDEAIGGSNNREAALWDNDDATNTIRATGSMLDTPFRTYDPPGDNWGLRILAMDVNSGNVNTSRCDISVETNVTETATFDAVGAADSPWAYADNFIVQGVVYIGTTSSNSGGWGDTEVNGLGEGYGIPVDFTLNDGYFIVTIRDPLPGTTNCGATNEIYIDVIVQRVYIP